MLLRLAKNSILAVLCPQSPSEQQSNTTAPHTQAGIHTAGTWAVCSQPSAVPWVGSVSLAAVVQQMCSRRIKSKRKSPGFLCVRTFCSVCRPLLIGLNINHSTLVWRAAEVEGHEVSVGLACRRSCGLIFNNKNMMVRMATWAWTEPEREECRQDEREQASTAKTVIWSHSSMLKLFGTNCYCEFSSITLCSAEKEPSSFHLSVTALVAASVATRRTG